MSCCSGSVKRLSKHHSILLLALVAPPEVEVSIDEDNRTLQTQDQEVLELALN